MADPIRLIKEARAQLEDADGSMTLEDLDAARHFADAIERVAAPGFTVVMAGGSMTTGREGVEGLEQLWTDFMTPWERLRVEPGETRVSEDGSVVVEFVRLVAKPRGVDAEIDQPAAALWRVRDGLLEKVEFHLDRDEALRAGGLTADPDTSNS